MDPLKKGNPLKIESSRGRDISTKGISNNESSRKNASSKMDSATFDTASMNTTSRKQASLGESATNTRAKVGGASDAHAKGQSSYSTVYTADDRIEQPLPASHSNKGGNERIDATSRFLQYLRDWEENFARQGGSAHPSPVSEISVPGFEPGAAELNTTWSTHTSTICCLNTYPNGITFSLHSNLPASNETAAKRAKAVAVDAEEEENPGVERRFGPDQFHLRFRDTRDLRTPAGRYHLHRENAARALEQHLAQLHRAGKLNETVLYFGTMTDPFLSLHKKFDVTMSCLDVIERYAPGRVVFQTRSPMVISVLPALKKLGSRAVVAIGVETNSEKAVLRYTPGMPRIAERLIAADGLRKQGVMVNLQVSPILPYGDFLRDAWDFAELLERHGDYVTFGCLSTGNPTEERFLRSMPIAQKLSADGMFAWLRPHAYQAVFHALSVLSREKLLLPVEKPTPPKQLKLFAA